MLDGQAYQLLGLTPRDVDRFSFRELWVMFAAARRREETKWMHTLAVCQAVQNWGSGMVKKPRPLDAMWKSAFGKARNTRMTGDQIRGVFSSAATKQVRTDG